MRAGLLVSLLFFGCEPSVPNPCSPDGPALACDSDVVVECNPDGTPGPRTDCAASGLVCARELGCVACRPNRFRCDGDDVQQCSADGTAWNVVATCTPLAGIVCDSSVGACTNPCLDAERTESYLGCEYWPTPIANEVETDFDFAVAVANPGENEAIVTITRGPDVVELASVPPFSVQTVRLPWIPELKDPFSAIGEPASVLVRDGAYRLRSNVPVAAYQFSPLQFRVDHPCGSPTTEGECFSHTNDASLLLPTHVLTGNYVALADRTRQDHFVTTYSDAPWGPTEDWWLTPGVLAIVGTAETPVTVEVTLRGHAAPSEDGAVTGGAPGDTLSFTLGAGDAVQLASLRPPNDCTADPADNIVEDFTGEYCEDCSGASCVAITCTTHVVLELCRVADEYDLTGSIIRASGPVMVLGGHRCALKPYNRFACDHLEESIFPLETWGNDFLVTRTQPLIDEPNIVRIVSGTDANTITFDPASVHDPITLDRGDFIDFETRADFRVSGSGPILVAQYLVGQSYEGGPAEEGWGDPSLSLAVPTAQFRTRYTVLTPDTYERSFLNVAAPLGAEVHLSTNGAAGGVVTGWEPIGETGMQRARVEVPPGTHLLTSSERFGVVVYGFALYTSYMYPGGLDFSSINPLI